MYNTYSQMKLKTSMLKSSLCDYSDPYILVSGTITVNHKQEATPKKLIKKYYLKIVHKEETTQIMLIKKVVFKNCPPFTDCINEINNTQKDNGKDIDVLMPMYNLIEYSDNYSKISASLWRYNRDERALTDDC